MVDRDSSALSTARFAGCLRAVPLLQTLMVGSNTPTPLHGVHSTTEGHLGVYLLLRGWGCPSCPSDDTKAGRLVHHQRAPFQGRVGIVAGDMAMAMAQQITKARASKDFLELVKAIGTARRRHSIHPSCWAAQGTTL